MAVEKTISQVTEKMEHLLRNEIMYLPRLKTRINRSIGLLGKCLKFFEDLKDGQGSTSTINDRKTDLLKAVYLTENAIDSFLARTALTKASPILYLKSFSDQIFLNNKMENIICQLSDQIQKMSGKPDDMGDSLVENLEDSQLQRSASKDAGEDTFERNIPDGRPDKEQAKPSEDMGVPSSNNLGDSQLRLSAKLKDFDENTSESNMSNERPAQEQAKLSEDTGVQPTDLSSNNSVDAGEITSERNMSDGRPQKEKTKLPPTYLGDAELEGREDVEYTSQQKVYKDKRRSAPPTDLQVISEIKEVDNRVEQVVSDRDSKSVLNEPKKAPVKRFLQRSETLSLYDETKIVPVKDKFQELSQLTLNRYAMYFLISVVGRAGSGKTHLVRQIFNHSQTRQNFEKLAFIPVSQNFKEREILAEILQLVAGEKDQEKLSFEVLQQKLRGFLARKRYLIVLDDVHSPDVWNKIKLAFPNSLKGSRVILTIRDANVARRIAPSIVLLHLRPLTDDESWKLFSISVKKDMSTLQENLKREILDKCQGLPLQILLLGGVLASRDFNPAEWSKVLNQIKAIGKEEKKRVEATKTRREETMTAQRPKQGEIHAAKVIEPVKQKETNAAQSSSPDKSVSKDSKNIYDLAYQDLSSTLRECFHYMCLFPKLSEIREIRTRRLFQLWFAEGLAGDTNAAEDVEKYIDDLVKRKMIKVAELRSDGKPKTCTVDDTLHDEFISYATDLGYHHIHGNSDSTSKSPNSNIRRLAQRVDPQDKRDLNRINIKDVRSYICFYKQKGDRPAEEVEKFIENTCNGRGFGLLTVLDLEGVYKPVLPKTLGKVLPLLKYVGLRWTFLDSIPESVGDLQFLETLDVKHTNITTLPISIWKAKELQHLYMNEIHFQMSIEESSSCGYPTKLQTLWGLLIGNRNPPIGLLKKLTGIRKLGLTCHTESLEELNKWISGLTGLRSLRLRAINEFIKPSEIRHLGSMKDHNELTDLYLLGKLPKAIDKSELPPKLTNLTLSVSQLSDDPMKMLGQLEKLKVLKLLADSYTGIDMTCLQGGFPKLEVLKLWMLKDLEKLIIEEGTMPELKELEIRYCPKLNKLDGLENLPEAFEEVTLTNMHEAFITEVKTCLGQKVREINHDFNPSWGRDE